MQPLSFGFVPVQPDLQAQYKTLDSRMLTGLVLPFLNTVCEQSNRFEVAMMHDTYSTGTRRP